MSRGRSSHYVQRVYAGCEQQFGGGPNACRVIWIGPLDRRGRQPPVDMMFGRREDRLRAAWRLAHGAT